MPPHQHLPLPPPFTHPPTLPSSRRFLNQRVPPDQQRVQYTAFDLSHHAKAARSHLLSDLQRLQEPVLQSTGIFASGGARGGSGGSGPPGSAGAGGAPAAQRTQHGVLRTNCIDSLDRTNVAQVGGRVGCGVAGRVVGHAGTISGGMLQAGAVCLHRLAPTNSALLWPAPSPTLQFTYGMLALGQQLHALGIAGAR
mgnify:CR=1 FL=1